MKKILIMKSFLFLLLLTGAGMAVISCSSEVEELEQEAVSVSFKTINEKGEYTTIFSNNENILFDLSIKNNTRDTIGVDGKLFLVEVLSSFKLYSSGGAFVGFPFSGIDLGKFEETAYNLMPDESRHWLCLFKTHQIEVDIKSPLESNGIREPLPQGEYYLFYSLTLDKETKTGKITFKID